MRKEIKKEWGVNGKSLLAKTPTGEVFLCDHPKFGKVILKIFTDIGSKDEGRGTFFYKAMEGDGAAHLYLYDSSAQLIEYLPGDDLYSYSRSNCEEKASQIFVQVIKKIRSKTLSQEDRKELLPLEHLFEILKRNEGPSSLKEVFSEAKVIASQLVSTAHEKVLLHGDLHHENIKRNKDGEFVCFDPKGLYGDKAYELATTLKNPWDFPSISQNREIFLKRLDYLCKELEYEKERVLGHFKVHLCLSILWAMEDGANYEHQENLLKKVLLS